MYYYRKGLKELENKFKIIQIDYEYLNERPSIDHIKSRIKSPESIINKLKKHGVPITYKNIGEDLHDVIGIRVIVPLKSDIETIYNYIKEMNDVEILKVKDYVKSPKPSGYRSFHVIIRFPIFVNRTLNYVKAEIQIRTLAMDFWASLEHIIQYKNNKKVCDNLDSNIATQLLECSKDIEKLDNKMTNFFL